jgi:LCP family protein required for cell wall assembly
VKKKKLKQVVITFVLLIISISAITSVVFYSYLSEFSKGFKNGAEKVEPAINKDKKEPINVLIMGVDIGTPGINETNNHQRTDTIILLNYNPKTESTNIISIPRDTLIKINGKNQKINAANVFGGVKYVIESVEQLLDVKVNYYSKLDYTGFREVIDIIGGVDITIKNRMDYDDSAQDLHIHFKKGDTVHLDGKKAEEYFRWRKNNDGTGLADGDLGRIENQHIFIEKVMDKFKSPSIITKIPAILKVMPKYVETNMPAEDILKYGTSIAKVNKESINMNTLQGDLAYLDEVSYLIYNKGKNKEVLDALGEGAQVVSQNVTIDKSKLKIQVLNATTKKGLAGSVSAKLKENGYTNIVTGNISKTSKSTITVYDIDKKHKDSITKDFNINNIVFKDNKNDKYDIVVILGDDYSGK